MMPRPEAQTKECPVCGKPAHWKATYYGATYKLGKYFCDDPNCSESYEKQTKKVKEQ